MRPDRPVNEDARHHYDVVVLGAGLAGLSLCRQLLLETDKQVLLVERREEIPPRRQKVGESSVQVAGYYFSKVLDLEEYLFRNHFMKYNLRFYWPVAGGDHSRFESLAQAYIRPLSNIASYQLDRNTFEAELLRRNREDPRFTLRAPTSGLAVTLGEGSEQHQVRFDHQEQAHEVTADWVVDTTGRGRFLARRLDLRRRNAIRHGAFFWWVDGLVDIERLTDRSRKEIRLHPNRRHTGHLPVWQATNHFMGEGFWFWVIPLQGKTSLGLVYDTSIIDHGDVFSVEKATAWICERFPLFARDLPQRTVLDFAGFRDFAHDCAQTIDPGRWAMAGEAGRFTDPLYSPGSDLIAIYNSLIVDAIQSDPEALRAKCPQYENLMRAIYAAYVPSYATSYDALGDQEAFVIKYTWELTIYFAGYVFPFINDLFTDRRFGLAFLRLFSQLGPVNRSIQQWISGYYQWKKQRGLTPAEPIFFDFTEIAPLRTAEKTFYEVGVSVEEGKAIFLAQVANVRELARFLVAHMASVVAGSRQAVTNRAFVESLDPVRQAFDPEAIRDLWRACSVSEATYPWAFDPHVLEVFHAGPQATAASMSAAEVGTHAGASTEVEA